SFIFAIMVLNVMSKDDFSDTNFSEADFPLEIDLPNTVFNVGDKISGTVTITNRSGKNVEIRSNGAMPCTYLHSNNDTSHNHPEMRGIKYHVLKAYDKMSRDFEWEAEESGTYVLYVHYTIVVNGVELRSELDDIIIEVR
ncbi:MAG: hypothetical protein FWC14_04315, partial [Candidatus Bathyarchaeota archaeon]|uniref:hypothetical protein n=1 Tax=Candidatus Bathycorpusculum sp. TaxID=2994959 RepID=UPI0028329CD6|nr:hypothetical protein [Candidatus Termiticorpusculum sp.]